MDTIDYSKQLVKFNLWANKRTADVLVRLTNDELNKEIISSFSSLRKTVYHIWDAELIWLTRINGESLTSFPSKQYGDTVAIDKFLECSMHWVHSVANKDAAFFEKKCTYKNLQQIEFTSSHFEIITHCMNHSTYHRGQLITLLRQAGISALPALDLIAFYRET